MSGVVCPEGKKVSGKRAYYFFMVCYLMKFVIINCLSYLSWGDSWGKQLEIEFIARQEHPKRRRDKKNSFEHV